VKDDELLGYPELISFLPEKWRQKQIGERIDGKVRFGSRHNESILVLPGIIRYLAKLPPAERKIGEQAEGRERVEQEERRAGKATVELMRSLGVDRETAQFMIADAKAKSSRIEGDEQTVAGV
jgi:hypothetical protein